MTVAEQRYIQWTTEPGFDAATVQELRALADRPAEIEDRFYTDLSFGTAGLRGVIGAGTNRMNFYTVAAAAEAFARVIAARGEPVCRQGMAISYDSRRYSREFAALTGRIFAHHGIRVLVSDELRPVPMLSFAIRHYQTAGGVMITASHNPAKYNGFKAYGEDGGQLPPEAAAAVAAIMQSLDDLPSLLRIPDESVLRANGLWQDMGSELDETYTAMLLKLAIHPEAVAPQSQLKIVYTPLHGAGNKPVRRVLSRMGFQQILVVPEQEWPDADFPTVSYPNPEERSALALAIALAEKEDADLVIATDPDADRTGVCVRAHDGSYQVLSGNQIGLLLTEYILAGRYETGTLPANSFVVSTIVSTRLTQLIARHYGVAFFECLTGFKYIGELIKEKDECGNMHYQFGFEESFGYLAGTDVRDKDAVVASMLISEMAAVAANHGLTLYDNLQAVYARYGYAAEKTISLTLEGKEGLDRIRQVMSTLRREKALGIPSLKILAVRDYLTRERTVSADGRTEALDLPESDVLLYELSGLDWFCIRPSGTEPKIKIYFGIYGSDPDACEQLLGTVRSAVEKHLKERL